MNPSTRFSFVTWTFSIALLAATSSVADGGGRGRDPGRENPELVQEWTHLLEKANAQIKSGAYEKGYRTADRLLHTMCSRIVSGEGAYPLMAMAATLRGVAESGRGNLEAGVWDLYLARAFVPDLDGGGPVMAYAALEAIRQWRFEPGTINGQPTEVHWNLTINFRSDGCPTTR